MFANVMLIRCSHALAYTRATRQANRCGTSTDRSIMSPLFASVDSDVSQRVRPAIFQCQGRASVWCLMHITEGSAGSRNDLPDRFEINQYQSDQYCRNSSFSSEKQTPLHMTSFQWKGRVETRKLVQLMPSLVYCCFVARKIRHRTVFSVR